MADAAVNISVRAYLLKRQDFTRNGSVTVAKTTIKAVVNAKIADIHWRKRHNAVIVDFLLMVAAAWRIKDQSVSSLTLSRVATSSKVSVWTDRAFAMISRTGVLKHHAGFLAILRIRHRE